jgi:transposase-like protein
MDMQSQQSLASKANGRSAPDPEVGAKAKRRRFSATYKARILEEVDRSPGQTGAILRREGLYSSHLTSWRRQRRAGTLAALGKKRGPKGKSASELENEKLRKEVARLQRELEKSQILIDAQKKLAEILGIDLPKIVGSGEEE